MPALTRRRYLERHDCWHVFFGDVHVGTIAVRAGVPVDVDQWGWDCGFNPKGRPIGGTAKTFDQARIDFEIAWREYLPRCTEADFLEYRRQRAWTAWKYAMQETHCRLPTQLPEGRAHCFCGAAIDIAGALPHVYAAHMSA